MQNIKIAVARYHPCTIWPVFQ